MAGDKFTLSVTILLTGFAVVFAILLLLIGIIKLYGTIIYNAQNRSKKKQQASKPAVADTAVDKAPEPVAVIEATTDDDELITVISAAVYSVYSSSQVRIKNIRKSASRTNAWRSAGLSDNIRPF